MKKMFVAIFVLSMSLLTVSSYGVNIFFKNTTGIKFTASFSCEEENTTSVLPNILLDGSDRNILINSYDYFVTTHRGRYKVKVNLAYAEDAQLDKSTVVQLSSKKVNAGADDISLEIYLRRFYGNHDISVELRPGSGSFVLVENKLIYGFALEKAHYTPGLRQALQTIEKLIDNIYMLGSSTK